MRRSLTFKLAIAFVLTSVIGIGLAALAARLVTVREFDRFVMEQLRSEFALRATSYFETRGSWDGVGQYFYDFNRPVEPGVAPRPPQFILTDPRGVVISPAQPYRAGDQVDDESLRRGMRIDVRGRLVGVVVDASRAPALSPRESQFLTSTNQALAVAALGALALALLLGVLLASNLTRPVRDLTDAIQAMARGALRQQVPVRSSDELGLLTQAFNQLSADLARSNEARRQMTADIAHDLRTPLTVINAYIEGLREGVFKPTQERFEAMHAEVQHLQHLVEDLRTLSLADAGELSMERISIGCQALMERLAAGCAPQAEGRAIRLLVRVEAGLPDISADPQRMIQALGNLTSNALRYTPAGGSIILSAYRQDGWVALVVQDSGVGIAPDKLPYIFDRFYRSDPARSEKDGESGLGLAIAKSIIEAHGGTIGVQSTPGRGTTFTVRMPVGPQ